MTSPQVIVVDDELAIRQVLAANLRKQGCIVEDFFDAEPALQRLLKGDVDIAICDIRMPGMSGIELMRKAQESNTETTFLLVTAHASLDTAIEAMRLGAFDYMIKPVHTEEILHQIKQITNMRELRSENRVLRSIVLKDKEKYCQLESAPIQEIKRMVERVAMTDSTVLITGESGTGKGVIARQIHKLSTRANGPFIPVNCGSIPENLLESEFFGHTKGAFTGADKAKNGLLVEADKGSIFLDEIGELPPHLQVKLLHVIDDKEVRAVGSEQVKRVNVRIITATNKDLHEMVAKGTYREDLYYRLNVFNIHIPPLRERPEDIRKLINFFVERDAPRFAQGRNVSIDPDAENMLGNYDWPGNIREMENVIARALILSDGGYISANELPRHITHLNAPHTGALKVNDRLSLRDQVRMFEYNVIRQTIEEAGGDRQAAARKLNIGQSTLYRKMEETEKETEMV